MSDRIKAIRHRAEKATEGPWEIGAVANEIKPVRKPRRKPIETRPDADGLNDAKFIANARQDIPYLLSEVDRMDATISTARTKLATIESVMLVAQRAGERISAETIMPLISGVLEDLRSEGSDE